MSRREEFDSGYQMPYDRESGMFRVRDPQGNPPQAHYRWMNHGEWTEAARSGSFAFGINAAVNQPDDRYQAGDHVLVRFPHDDATWDGKDDSISKATPYVRARGQVPFESAQVLRVNPLVPSSVVRQIQGRNPNVEVLDSPRVKRPE